MSAAAPALEVDDVGVRLADGSTLLAPVALRLEPGESLAVVGRSGVGKSTLAATVLGLRAPTTGAIRVLGEAWASPGRGPRQAQRHLVQGVPQDAAAALMPRWSLQRSIETAVRRLTDVDDPAARVRDAARTARLDPDLLARRPHQVSGGQAQRAAIARAIAVGPRVLVADEPTSALDAATSGKVADTLVALTASTGVGLLLLTHDPAVAARCDRTLTLTAPARAGSPTGRHA